MKPQKDEEERLQRDHLGYISLIPELASTLELCQYDNLELYEENLWTFKNFDPAAFQTQTFGSPYTVDDNEHNVPMQIAEDVIINNNIPINKKMPDDEELNMGADIFDFQSQQVLNSLPGLNEFIIELNEAPCESITDRVNRLANLANAPPIPSTHPLSTYITIENYPNVSGRRLLNSVVHALISFEDITLKSLFNSRVACNLFALYEIIFEQLVLKNRPEFVYGSRIQDRTIERHSEMMLKSLTQATINLTISKDIGMKSKELLLECQKIKAGVIWYLEYLSDSVSYIEWEYYRRGIYDPKLSRLISAFLFEQHCARESVFSVYYEAKSVLNSEPLQVLIQNFDQWLARMTASHKIGKDEIKSTWDDSGKLDVFDPLTLIFQSLQRVHTELTPSMFVNCLNLPIHYLESQGQKCEGS